MYQKIIQEYRAAFSGIPSKVWLLAFVVLVNRSGSMVLFFLTLYLTSQLGFTISEAGQFFSIYGAGALIGAFAGGWLSDRIGPYRVQLFSLMATGIGFIWLGYQTTPDTIALTLFFVAIVAESFRPANAASVSACSTKEIRARSFGLNRQAINLGVAIGPAVGGLLARMEYHYIFWADGLTCLAGAVLLMRYFHDDPNLKRKDRSSSLPLRMPWRDTGFHIILGLTMILGMVFMQTFNTWPMYLKSIYLLTEDRIGLLMALNGVLIILIEMPLLRRIEKLPRSNMLAFGAFLLLAGFAMTGLGTAIWFAALTVIIWTVGEMLVFPLTSALIADRADDRNIGAYMGMYTFNFSLTMIVGPVLGTYAYDFIGPDAVWIAIAILAVPVAAGFRLLGRFFITDEK
jgi:predicted MFS family arabinose efflux permease